MPLTPVPPIPALGQGFKLSFIGSHTSQCWTSESDEVPALKEFPGWLGGGQWEADKEIVQVVLEQGSWGLWGYREGLGRPPKGESPKGRNEG